MSLNNFSDDEFGDFNFLTSAGTKNQAKFKSKTPIRRERERSTSSSSLNSVSPSSSIYLSDEEVPINDASVQEVVSVISKKTPRMMMMEVRLRKRRKEDNKVIKIHWNYEIHRISIHRNAKVSDLILNFAEKLSISSDELMLSLNDKPMNKDSSVEEIKVIDILHAYKGIQDEDLIELKIQDGKSRDPVMVKLKPSETVSSLIEMYISKKDDSIKFEEVSLIFDGEVLEKKESLKVLDFEGGECIDVVICQMIPEKTSFHSEKNPPQKK
ncbi:unnamed protein product [Lepeophtheirus salmonis]|uniref:(salmon louse) hypothetical protein n=1 Tax=Lepeophtheirus salmonis TaxID=72036 RepID=A0A7R8CKA3_LEPSM|nr:unnamed protein product [Lepeophtheirus salmonis]CAF2847384.1 unnamed protein product [Lepeophtheirus salmonis]